MLSVMQKIREKLSLILLALLPLHALFVTVMTKLIAGPHQSPLWWLAIWKEAFFVLLVAFSLYEYVRSQGKKITFAIDRIDIVILVLFVLGTVVSFFTHRDLVQMIYGIRYDFVPLIAFLILRRVPWSDEFYARAARLLVWVGLGVTAYGLISFFLPMDWFRWLGYSDLHSEYLPNNAVAAFQQIGDHAIRRWQSTFSGPNQFGLWLLIPYSFALISALSVRARHFDNVQHMRDLLKPSGDRDWYLPTAMAGALLIGIAGSFSRAAWIASFAITVAAVLWYLPRSVAQKVLIRIGMPLGFFLLLFFTIYPNILLRITSSRDHIYRPIQAVQTMIAQPFGLGLGTAGPASNRISDVCKSVNSVDDTAWAVDRPEICFFVGEAQIKPTDRVCHCPVLPENWYLQIGVEMGWLGFVLFIYLLYLLYRTLLANRSAEAARSLLLALSGISLAALVLHAWEDTAVAYTLWLMLAALPAFQKPVAAQ